jgi:hypothetical protein
VIWRFLVDDMTLEDLGLIPHFFDEADPRSAIEQVDANYAHGGGWSPIPGFTVGPGSVGHYPGDAPFEPLAIGLFRDETVIYYAGSFVAIINGAGLYQVARLD